MGGEQHAITFLREETHGRLNAAVRRSFDAALGQLDRQIRDALSP